ncbi:MAG: RDD family protein [Acidobacteriota bacterium]
MRSTLRLRTPEGIEFALPLAGPASRFLAWTIDLACIAALDSVVVRVTTALAAISADVTQAIAVVSFFVIQVGYGIATEWALRGQTIGKRLVGLRVVDDRGLRLAPWQIVARNLLRTVDSLPLFYLVGGAAVVLSRNGQRLGDWLAGTVVVRARKPALPDLDQLLAVKYNSLRAHAHIAARLRQRLTSDDALLGLRALIRRDDLDPAARVTLFREVADHYRSLARFPDEAVEGLADEQYVRNVVDIAFRASLPATTPAKA